MLNSFRKEHLVSIDPDLAHRAQRRLEIAESQRTEIVLAEGAHQAIIELTYISAVRHVVSRVGHDLPAVAPGVKRDFRSGLRWLHECAGTRELRQLVNESRKPCAAELREVYLSETAVEITLKL